MKYIIYAFLALTITCGACTKTKTVTVIKNDTTATIVHDTVFNPGTLQPALWGSWSNGDSAQNCEWPIFGTDLLSYACGASANVKYSASKDSIYVLGFNYAYYTKYYYRLSAKNDTLYLQDITISGSSATAYYRIN